MDAPGGPPPIHPPIAASLRNPRQFPPSPTVPPISSGQNFPAPPTDQRKPNVPVPSTRAIFVGNFEYDSRTADIENLFSKYGSVTRVDLKRGFAFVFMQSEEQGETAIRALDGKALDETRRRPLKVEWARGDGAIKRREDERRRRSTEPSDTLFVVNFDPVSTTRQQLEHLFGPFGQIVRLDLQQRFAFIQFGNVEHATTALHALNGVPLGDRYLIVEYTVRSVGAALGRRRPRDHMMPPIDGPRPMMPRNNYRRGRSPSPRGMHGRLRHDRPWGPRPPHPDDHPYSPRGFRGREVMSYYNGNRESDSGWGEHLERFRAERGLKEARNRERREEAPKDFSRRHKSRSPSPARKYRNLSRSRSRSTSPTVRKRARSRSRSWDRGVGNENRRRSPHAKSLSPYRRGTRKSQSNSRSRSPQGRRYHTESPTTERGRGSSPLKGGNNSSRRSRSPVASRSGSPDGDRTGHRSSMSDRSQSRSPGRGRGGSCSPSRKRARSPSVKRSGRGYLVNDAKSAYHGDRTPSPKRRRNISRSPGLRRSRSRNSSRSDSRSPRRRGEWHGNREQSQSLSRSRSRSHTPRKRSPDHSSRPALDRDTDGARESEDMTDNAQNETEIPVPSYD